MKEKESRDNDMLMRYFLAGYQYHAWWFDRRRITDHPRAVYASVVDPGSDATIVVAL